MNKTMILTNKMFRILGVAVLFALMLVAVFGNSSKGGLPTAAADSTGIYARIEGTQFPIKGDSVTKGHEGEVVVSSFDQSYFIPTSLVTGSGRPTIGKLSITKAVDPASVSFYRASVSGISIPTVTFTFQKTNGTTVSDFYQVILSDVRISSIVQAATASNGIVETVEFEPTKVTWKNLATGTTYGWDYAQNKAF